MSNAGSKLDPIERAIADLAAGRAVVVVDAEDRENEGDLILAADAITPEQVAFLVRHTSGVVCAPMEAERLDQLGIQLMTPRNNESMRTAFTVTVDAAEGVTTGISAADRAHTLRLLADSRTKASDLVQPGHIFPLRARPGGVLERAGHTEAAVDLTRLAGRTPCGVLAELVDDDGTMLRGERLRAFAAEHELTLVSVEDLIRYRRRTEQVLRRESTTRLPTVHGEFTAYGYRDVIDGTEQVALVLGEPGKDALVRLHSECLTGDVFGSLRCDCGPQLQAALATVAQEGRGIVLYIRGHEGRGIGLLHKLQAYQLQDMGIDTVDANLDLGLPADARDYGTGAQILVDLGVHTMRLLTNNPAKRAGLEGYGLKVIGRVPLPSHVTAENLAYLRTKRDRMGHLLDIIEPETESGPADAATVPGTGVPLRQREQQL
jgi:3,4-dihydroxy 2-butanone 4-phosphate synthase / GTP cyclohydrolase II